jgi:hypothetical protein
MGVQNLRVNLKQQIGELPLQFSMSMCGGVGVEVGAKHGRWILKVFLILSWPWRIERPLKV